MDRADGDEKAPNGLLWSFRKIIPHRRLASAFPTHWFPVGARRPVRVRSPFEHMMFEGTPVAPKGTFDRVVEGGGGWINGDTRWDFTEYIDTAPVAALDRRYGSRRTV